MPELKPCPFCGGEAKFHITSIPLGETLKGYFQCENFCCEQCHVQSIDDAADDWNRRADSGKET